MVELLEDFIWPDGKIWLQKNCKNFANELQSLKRVMRGFQKGITLGGRASGRFHMAWLQNWVAKKFANELQSL